MKGNMTGRGLSAVRGPEILDALPDGAYVTDTDRKIVFWNRAAERIMGWPADEVAGRNCSDNILVHVDKDGHELCGKEYCPLHRCIVTGEASVEPLLVYARHRSGARVPVEVSVAPLRDGSGAIVGGIELFRDLSEVERDLALARQIQGSFLESALPPDPRVVFGVRYSASETVGGDFYRIERLDADRYAVMVADVMGHGVASALYTMLLRSLWEESRPLLARPAEFLGVLNRKLRVLAREPGYFATAVFAVIDAATGAVTWARAGHPAPFLVGGRGRVVPLEGPGQPALGMLDEVAFTEQSVSARPGSSLLFFTDGAIEALDARGNELGADGLARLVALPGSRPGGVPALDRVEEGILAFSGALHPADDLTLIAVTWKARRARA